MGMRAPRPTFVRSLQNGVDRGWFSTHGLSPEQLSSTLTLHPADSQKSQPPPPAPPFFLLLICLLQHMGRAPRARGSSCDISALMGRGDTQGVDPTELPCPFGAWEPPAWALPAPSEGDSPWALQSDPPADLSSSPFGLHPYCTRGFPGSSVVNNPPWQSRRRRFDLWIQKIPWRRK